MKKLFTVLFIGVFVFLSYVRIASMYQKHSVKKELKNSKIEQGYAPYSTKEVDTYTVERVIDGDTILLTIGEEVQLIGIDAPEIVDEKGQPLDSARGKEATEFVEDLVKSGQEVRLEFDVQEKDKYGRLLAYVYIRLGESKVLYKEYMLNTYIVASGYAQPMTIPPNVKYAELFQELYEEARENRRGLWMPEGAIIKEMQTIGESRDSFE